MAVFSERRGIGLCDLFRGETEQPGHDAGIEYVHLGVLDDPGAKGGAPGREAVNEEDGFEELDVVLSRRPLQADSSGDRSYVEYLPRPGGKLAQQPGQHLALSDSRDVHNVFIHYQVHVVGEPPGTRPAWRAAQGHWHPPCRRSPSVFLSCGSHRAGRRSLDAVAVEELAHEGLTDSVNLALSQREYGDDVNPAG